MQYLLDSSSFFQSLHIERWSSLAVFTHDSSFLALLNAKFLTQRIVGKAEKFVSLTKQWLIALVQCWVDPEDLLNYNRAAIHYPGALQHTSVWLPAATHTHTHTHKHTHTHTILTGHKILGFYSHWYPHKYCIFASPLIKNIHKCTLHIVSHSHTHTHTHTHTLKQSSSFYPISSH